MSRRKSSVCLLLGLAACDGGSEPAPASRPALPAAPPAGWLQPVVAERLRAYASYRLPEVAPAQRRLVAELLDVAASGSLGRRARRELEEYPLPALSAALLAVVEDRESPVELRRAAGAWLAARPDPAALPALILRLKYEKDWPANVDLALALLRLGNGSGLAALRAILSEENLDQAGLECRAAAAAALQELPGRDPGADFAADWQMLLLCEQRWLAERRLRGAPEEDRIEDPAVLAACWQRIADFASQPLRPVDDARYVLTRMGGGVIPLLVEAARDQDRYVRAHALETLGWIGYPVGRWIRRSGYDYWTPLANCLSDAAVRGAALAALGASGMARAADLALPWLAGGDLEERTAAADVLLLCGEARHLPAVEAALAGPALGAEARYSLSLLKAEWEPGAPAPVPPAELAPGERERRQAWAEQRARRPGLE